MQPIHRTDPPWQLDAIQQALLRRLAAAGDVKKLLEQLQTGAGAAEFSGLPCAGLALLITLLSLRGGRPLCLLTSSPERAQELALDLEFFGHPRALLIPKWEILPYEPEEPVLEFLAREMQFYASLLEQREPAPQPQAGATDLNFEKLDPRRVAPVYIAPIEACLVRVAALEDFLPYTLTFEWGERYNLEHVAQRLVECGYRREPMVESHGEFSVRGGIVDIFPVTFRDPVRLDFFGDDLESIRYFDLATQRSLPSGEQPERLMIPPAFARGLHEACARAGRPLRLLPELLPADTLFVRDDPERWPAPAGKFAALVQRQYREALKDAGDAERAAQWREPPPPDKLFADLDALEAILARRPAVTHRLLHVEGAAQSATRFHVASFEQTEPKLETYLQLIRRKQHEDFLIDVICDNNGQVLRLDELLREHEIASLPVLEEQRFSQAPRPRDALSGYPEIVVTTGLLNNGFIWPAARLLLVTDREIFGRYKRRHAPKNLYSGRPLHAATDIARGDYIVHVEHGIGRFLGIRRQELDGRRVDLFELEYAEQNKLLVPVEKIRNLQKYSVVEQSVAPALDKLGAQFWLKRKRKSQAEIEQLARELLSLYASREAARGHGCGPDSVWQNEFEASFIYEETPDQLAAIEQVKVDLESDKPMDRLVCGDVGYGKTEVAIRAAFKVIQEKRQVVVLCPTTILAQQHWQTFSERFADYPVRCEMLSRFRTLKEQREILKKLRLGELDLVVGTHRLLSRDVDFYNVGLLIVDEEQRFGVKHKERIKQLKTSIHVLTLTATPIPRTLYMALSGLRDMSLIATPPANRLPIRTKIIHFEQEMIKEAILRELNRGGQVFFVHNRVHNIDQVADRLRAIAPEARIEIAHGQMDNRTLEKTMLRFIAGEFDILLSTTIIENGLDIPNVNTIIINRADAFGLAQLYQLRGRVGRDVRRAYAYLIVPKGQPITDPAMRRLAAIEEFTELGRGFDVAMRDLEIRGTGNLLGAQQHGVMNLIGFELYCDLLQRAVRELSGVAQPEERTVEIKWKCDSYLPESYMPVETQRVNFYRKLSALSSERAVRDVAEELRDRYGEPPAPARNLLNVALLRALAGLARLRQVQMSATGFRITPEAALPEYLTLLARIEKSTPEMKNFRVESADDICIDCAARTADEQLAAAIKILRRLAETQAADAGASAAAECAFETTVI